MTFKEVEETGCFALPPPPPQSYKGPSTSLAAWAWASAWGWTPSARLLWAWTRYGCGPAWCWLAGIATLGTPGSVKSSVVPRAPFCVSNWKSRTPSTQVGSLGSVGVPSGLLGLAGSQNCTGVSTLILIGG